MFEKKWLRPSGLRKVFESKDKIEIIEYVSKILSLSYKQEFKLGAYYPKELEFFNNIIRDLNFLEVNNNDTPIYCEIALR